MFDLWLLVHQPSGSTAIAEGLMDCQAHGRQISGRDICKSRGQPEIRALSACKHASQNQLSLLEMTLYQIGFGPPMIQSAHARKELSGDVLPGPARYTFAVLDTDPPLTGWRRKEKSGASSRRQSILAKRGVSGIRRVNDKHCPAEYLDNAEGKGFSRPSGWSLQRGYGAAGTPSRFWM